MNKFLKVTSALALLLSVSSAAFAGPHSGGSSHSSSSSSHSSYGGSSSGGSSYGGSSSRSYSYHTETPLASRTPTYESPRTNYAGTRSSTPDITRAITPTYRQENSVSPRAETPVANTRRYGNQYGSGVVGTDKNGNTARVFQNQNTGTITNRGTDQKGRAFEQQTRANGSSTRTTVNADGRGTTTIDRGHNGRIQGETLTHVRADGSVARTQVSIDKQGNRVTEHASGNITVRRADGSVLQTRANGYRVLRDSSGTRIYQDRSGRELYRDQYRVTSSGRIKERVVIINNRTYVNNYYGYNYGGFAYYAYTPFYWYPTSYYNYLWSPWNVGFSYRWGVYNDPWYYTPYVSYCGPVCWLTDYVILSNLEAQQQAAAANSAAINAQAAANAAASANLNPGESVNCTTATGGGWFSSGSNVSCAKTAAPSVDVQAPAQASQDTPPANGAPVTAEAKAQINAQVSEALRAHQNKQSLTLDSALKDPKYIFTVDDDTDAAFDQAAADGSTKCTLNQGDMLKVVEQRENAALVSVVATRGEGCDLGSKVIVTLDRLQAMQNAFMEKVDNGLKKMADSPSSFPNAPQGVTPQVNAQEAPATTPAN